MEQQLQTILLDDTQDTIKLFQKNEFYYVYTHLHLLNKFTNAEYNAKQREIKISEPQYEELVKYIILTLRMQLIEYKNTKNDYYTATKKALYSNWNDYADILYDDLYQPVSAIHYDHKCVYISFFNMLNNTIYYTSFEDDDIFSILYSYLTEINCNQVCFENAKLQKPLQNMGINLNFIKSEQNTAKNMDEIADKNIVKSINLLVQTQNLKNYKLCEYKTNDFMKIDNKTIETLDINHILNLFQPYTKQGKRLLSQMVKQPLKDAEMITKRLEFTEYFYNLQSDVVKGFPDFIVYSKRILKLKIKDCITVYYGLQKVKSLIESITNHQAANNETHANNYNVNEQINNHIYNTIYDEFILPLTSIDNTNEQLFIEMHKIIDFETNELKSNFSEKIQDLKASKDEIEQNIKEEYERVSEINKKVKIESIQNGTYQFKIPRSEYKIFSVNNFVEKSMLKSGILFTTKNLEMYNTELTKINNEYSKEEKDILDNFLIFMNNYSTSLEALNHLIAMIDVYIAFGKSKDYGFTKPSFNSYFSVKGAFHPLISDCVKNDFDLGVSRSINDVSQTTNDNKYDNKYDNTNCW
ncbi:MSH2 protein [Binucleata daphniae]